MPTMEATAGATRECRTTKCLRLEKWLITRVQIMDPCHSTEPVSYSRTMRNHSSSNLARQVVLADTHLSCRAQAAALYTQTNFNSSLLSPTTASTCNQREGSRRELGIRQAKGRRPIRMATGSHKTTLLWWVWSSSNSIPPFLLQQKAQHRQQALNWLPHPQPIHQGSQRHGRPAGQSFYTHQTPNLLLLSAIIILLCIIQYQ